MRVTLVAGSHDLANARKGRRGESSLSHLIVPSVKV
jgi:hypothetical protein